MLQRKRLVFALGAPVLPPAVWQAAVVCPDLIVETHKDGSTVHKVR